MGDTIYGALQQLGYGHPIHPLAVHLPVGLVIAVFLFSVAAMLLRNSALAQTARHCAFLALVAVPVAAVAGLLDWQHFYRGVWTTPFIVKMVLAVLLTISLAVAVFKGMKKDVLVKRLVPIYFFSLATVAGLGFIGGELVYGTRGMETSPPGFGQAPAAAPADKTDQKDPSAGRSPEGQAPDPARVAAGKVLFGQKCSFCHHTESSDAKIGPGLKGLFERDRLPVSKLPVTEKNVRSQIRKPYDSMPPFPDLPPDDVEAVVAYLKTI